MTASFRHLGKTSQTRKVTSDELARLTQQCED